jgi:WhiB family redox-sensing transcriptional regulator
MSDWRHAAACRDEDPELFFSTLDADIADAKAICARCHVRSECGQYADDNARDHGIYGGRTADERKRLRRRRERDRARRRARAEQQRRHEVEIQEWQRQRLDNAVAEGRRT